MPARGAAPTHLLGLHREPAVAHAAFEAHDKGSIEPGKLADFAVLNQHPFAVDAERWQEIKVGRTMLGGKWVYES